MKNRNISIKFHELFILICFSVFSSCELVNNYTYVETATIKGNDGKEEVFERDPSPFKHDNDTLAYLFAYKLYATAIKYSNDFKDDTVKIKVVPKSFKVYDKDGKDITDIKFYTKNMYVERINDSINNLENLFKNSPNKIIDYSALPVDSIDSNIKIEDNAKIKQLKKYFRIKKDEFSTDHTTWYEPKTAPRYINANGIYCYFHTSENIAMNLRLKLQYYAEDWLFFHKVVFAIDGKAYEYYPTKVEQDNGDGGYIWEWFDDSVNTDSYEIIKALSTAKSAKMKLIGRQYHKIKTITRTQIQSIKQTLDLYEAMGGTI